MDGPYLLPPSPLIPLRLTTHSFKTAAGGRTRSVARKYWSSLVGMMIEPVPSTCSSLLTNVLTKIPKDGIGKHDDNTLCPSVRVSESFMECIFEHRNSFIFTFFFFHSLKQFLHPVRVALFDSQLSSFSHSDEDKINSFSHSYYKLLKWPFILSDKVTLVPPEMTTGFFQYEVYHCRHPQHGPLPWKI